MPESVDRCPYFQAALDKVEATLTRPSVPLGAAIARLVGCSRQASHKALQLRRRCPAAWAVPLSRATGVPRSCLRPDLYPAAEDPDLRGRRDRPATPPGLEAAGQLCIPGTERKRSRE